MSIVRRQRGCENALNTEVGRCTSNLHQGKRLRLALQSGVPSELAWALNVLALGSSAAASPLELCHHPDLLPLVLQVQHPAMLVMISDPD